MVSSFGEKTFHNIEWFFGFLLGHVNLLALPQHQHTSFLCPDVSDRIALSFFKELSLCCQLHLSHLVNLTHGLHFCFLVFVLVIFTPPPLYFSCFNSFRVQAVFVCWPGIFLSVCFPVAFSSRSHVDTVRLPSKLPFCHFSKLYFVFDFVQVFSFLNLELFVTVPLFKSSLKKDRAILSETSGQRKFVCWCWGRAKRFSPYHSGIALVTKKLPSVS